MRENVHDGGLVRMTMSQIIAVSSASRRGDENHFAS
jgi:hypothetical protein